MMSSIATVYTGPGQTGSSRTFGVALDERARWFDSFQMIGAGLYRTIRSVRVNASSRADTRLFLFRDPGVWGLISPFQNDFLEVSVRRGSSASIEVDLADHGFDAQTTSLVLVSTRREYDELFQSAEAEFGPTWTTEVDDVLAGSAASAVGGPVFRWLPATAPTMTGTQALSVRAAGRDYDAQFTLTIALGLVGARPSATITNSTVWVESGSKSGRIRRRLGDEITTAVPSINATLATTVTSPVDLEDLYVLPGRQGGVAPTGVTSGNTRDDVTVVADLTLL